MFSAGEYEGGIEDNSSRLEGDWNHDQDFDSMVDATLAFGGYSQSSATPTAAFVPEPTDFTLVFLTMGLFLRCRLMQECVANISLYDVMHTW